MFKKTFKITLFTLLIIIIGCFLYFYTEKQLQAQSCLSSQDYKKITFCLGSPNTMGLSKQNAYDLAFKNSYNWKDYNYSILYERIYDVCRADGNCHVNKNDNLKKNLIYCTKSNKEDSGKCLSSIIDLGYQYQEFRLSKNEFNYLVKELIKNKNVKCDFIKKIEETYNKYNRTKSEYNDDIICNN